MRVTIVIEWLMGCGWCSDSDVVGSASGTEVWRWGRIREDLERGKSEKRI